MLRAFYIGNKFHDTRIGESEDSSNGDKPNRGNISHSIWTKKTGNHLQNTRGKGNMWQ